MALDHILAAVHMYEPVHDGSSKRISSTPSLDVQTTLITPAPELRLRNAAPEPQAAADCSQAEQSASQAIQQASQEASQSIQQASQSASQAIQQASQSASQASQQASQSASQASQQASQSASQAIQQAQQSAEQSISAASRSISSAISSASSAISSMQASAQQAIAFANEQMSTAQFNASAAQSQASYAILQAGAAVAAATGSAAAAGSSFLAAAANATQSAQASISAIGSEASSLVTEANQQATASQVQAMTIKLAIAVVGSVIASTLLTVLVYFLVSRHRKRNGKMGRSRSRSDSSRGMQSPEFLYVSDSKLPIPTQLESTIVDSHKGDVIVDNQGDLKRTTLPWNPSNPPRAPSLRSWLKVQGAVVSPFGPINLPTTVNSDLPLGGQLKSPMRSVSIAKSSPKPTKAGPQSPRKGAEAVSVLLEVSNPPGLKSNAIENEPRRDPSSRDSKPSIWTDDVPYDSPSVKSTPGAPMEPMSVTLERGMQLPAPQGPVRNTAEWFAAQAVRMSTRTSVLAPPQDTKTSQGPSPSEHDLSARPGPSGRVQSLRAEARNGGGSAEEAGINNRSSRKIDRPASNRNTRGTSGVGKAL